MGNIASAIVLGVVTSALYDVLKWAFFALRDGRLVIPPANVDTASHFTVRTFALVMGFISLLQLLGER